MKALNCGKGRKMNGYENLLWEIIAQEEEFLLNMENFFRRLLSMYKELELSIERDGFGEEREEFVHFKLNLETLTGACKIMERGKWKGGRSEGNDFSEIGEWMEGMRIFCMTYEQRMRGNKNLLEALKELKGVKNVRMGGKKFFEEEASYPFVHSVLANDYEDCTMQTIYDAPERSFGFESYADPDESMQREETPIACVYAPPEMMGRAQRRERKGLFSRIFKKEP